MSKIVIDARLSGTSTGRYIDKLVEYIAKEKSAHTFTVLAHPHRVEELKKLAPDFHIVRTDFRQFTLGEQTGLRKQIKSLKPDLVHFPAVQQPIRYHGKVVTTMQDLTTLRFKNPTANSLVFSFRQKIYERVNRVAARKSKQLITISEFVRDDIIKTLHAKPEKISVTYLSADKIKAKATAIPELKGKQFIMYVGRPQPHKNLGRLISAFQILLNEFPDLKLVLAGKKDVLFAQHEKRVEEMGLSGSVIFTDFVSEGQLRWLYENCRAYVFPSLSEGFGLPGLEAMIHGAPVISSNATCLPEIYDGAAYYFNPNDVEDMATIISHVLENDELRKSLVRKGAAQVKQYSWEKMAKETLAVYEKALNT